MKYNQPYGVSDVNAPYINGNPATGTAGSIPPAASIEHPQREIVGLINDCGIAPNEGDLAQLAKAVQSGKLNYGIDTGAASNTILVALPRPPDTPLRAGLMVLVLLAHPITGATTINVNSIGAVPVVHGDGTPLKDGDGVAGQLLLLGYDGTKFQMLGGAIGLGDTSGIRVKLTGNLTLYICVTGSDLTGDGTILKPWRTRQFAWYRAQAIYDLVYTYTLTFQMCDGTYSDPALDPFVASGVFVGATGPASILFQGNMATPANCVVNLPSAAWTAQNGAQYRIQGFTSISTTRYAVLATIYGWLSIGPNNVFPASAHAHIAADVAGTIDIFNNYTITGGSEFHWLATTGSFIFASNNIVVTLVGTVPFSHSFGGSLQNGNLNMPGSMVSFVGGATGQRYFAAVNGVIVVNGAGETFFPGNAAGVKATGGQYV